MPDAGAESKLPPANGNTITTGMREAAATASGSQAPSSSAPLATAATLAQGIAPATAPQAAAPPSSNAAGNPEAAAARTAPQEARAAGPDVPEPPLMFPAASLRLPSAELQSAAGLSAGGDGLPAMDTPRDPAAVDAAAAAAAAATASAGGSAQRGGRAAASSGDCSRQHAVGAASHYRGDSSSAEELPASQCPAGGNQRSPGGPVPSAAAKAVMILDAVPTARAEHA